MGPGNRGPRSLPGPSPSANSAGNWKGDPLGPQVAAPSDHPVRNKRVAYRAGDPCGLCLFGGRTFVSAAAFERPARSLRTAMFALLLASRWIGLAFDGTLLLFTVHHSGFLRVAAKGRPARRGGTKFHPKGN